MNEEMEYTVLDGSGDAAASDVSSGSVASSASEMTEETSEDPADLLEIIQQQTAPHPMLTTDFADYTVTEGLLLLILLVCFVSVCFKMLKEGFSWLN